VPGGVVSLSDPAKLFIESPWRYYNDLSENKEKEESDYTECKVPLSMKATKSLPVKFAQTYKCYLVAVKASLESCVLGFESRVLGFEF
jgi:hypothetical protein